jgi:DNA invertase Pin-like site-specific DNA recombinase
VCWGACLTYRRAGNRSRPTIAAVYGKIPSKLTEPGLIKSRLCGVADLKGEGVGIMKRAAIYLRVSTVDQHTRNQELELRQAAERAGWEVVEVYTDHGISGAKGRDKRPACDALCRDASRRRFDIVMAWSVDRLGRSLQDLVNFLSELDALKVDLFLRTQGIDTTTPSGKAMFGMLSVFADFERSIIQERVRAGLLRARREGKRLGRPPIKMSSSNALWPLSRLLGAPRG